MEEGRSGALALQDGSSGEPGLVGSWVAKRKEAKRQKLMWEEFDREFWDRDGSTLASFMDKRGMRPEQIDESRFKDFPARGGWPGLPGESGYLQVAIVVGKLVHAKALVDLGCRFQGDQALWRALSSDCGDERVCALVSSLVKNGAADPFKVAVVGERGASTGLESMDAFELAVRVGRGARVVELIKACPHAHFLGRGDAFKRLPEVVELAELAGFPNDSIRRGVRHAARDALADMARLIKEQSERDALDKEREQALRRDFRGGRGKEAAEACMASLLGGRFGEAMKAMAGAAADFGSEAADHAWRHLDTLRADASAPELARFHSPVQRLASFHAPGQDASTGPGMSSALLGLWDAVVWLAKAGARSDLDAQLLLASDAGMPGACAALIEAGASPLAATRALGPEERALGRYSLRPPHLDSMDALELCCRAGSLPCAAKLCEALASLARRDREVSKEVVRSLARAGAACQALARRDDPDAEAKPGSVWEMVELARARLAPDGAPAPASGGPGESTRAELAQVRADFEEFKLQAEDAIQKLSRTVERLSARWEGLEPSSFRREPGVSPEPMGGVARAVQGRRESALAALGKAQGPPPQGPGEEARAPSPPKP